MCENAELFRGANGGGRRSFESSSGWCPPPSLTSPLGDSTHMNTPTEPFLAARY